MKTHSINLKPYQLTAASEGRLGLVCLPFKGITEFQKSNTRGYKWTFRNKRLLWNDVRNDEELIKLFCPYTQGDVLVGREAYSLEIDCDGDMQGVHKFQADYPNEKLEYCFNPNEGEYSRIAGHTGYLPASTLPLNLARYRWTITDVKPLWLPEITPEQARMCGFGGIHVKEHMESGWAYSHKKPFESWAWALSVEVKGE